jgi:hypothetical protein
LGERVWLNRKKTPIPKHFLSIINILNIISGVGTKTPIPVIKAGCIECLKYWNYLECR